MNSRRLCAALLLGLSLAGCGDDDGSSSTVESGPNQAPTISGAPPAQADEDAAYIFTPDADDPDGDTLTFAVENAPAWASFDTATGTLSGTPTRADVGMHEDIRITVSDGQASAELDPFAVEVVQVWNLTLEGAAFDAPVANAVVTVAGGGAESTATADAQGRYAATLRLRAGDFDPAAVLRVTARGVDAQAHVELTSQVGSVGRVIELAGDDEALTASEEPRLNATHVSTARYLLASDANGRSAPANDVALRDAEAAIDTTRLIETAAIVKVLADTQASAVLPEGETTLSALETDSPSETSNATVMKTFLADAGFADETGAYTADFRTSLDEAIATVADGSTSGGFTPAMLAGTTVWTSATHPDWVPRGGFAIDFDMAGSGVSFEKADRYTEGLFYSDVITDVREPFQWTVDGGVLRIDYDDFRLVPFDSVFPYDELVTRFGFDQSVADFLTEIEANGTYVGFQLPIVHDYQTRTVTLVSATPGVPGRPAVMHVRSHYTIEYSLDDLLTSLGWTGPLPRGSGTAQYDHLVYPAGSAVSALEQAPAAGETWAMPVIYTPLIDVDVPPLEGLYTDVFTLEEDGTTSPGMIGDRTFAWLASQEGIVLDAGNERYVYTPMQASGGLYSALVSLIVDGEVALRQIGLMTRADESGAAFPDDLVQELPLYWQGGINTETASSYRDDGLLQINSVFGYTFAADGTNEKIVGSPFGAACLGDDAVACFTRESSLFTTEIVGTRIVRDGQTLQQTRTWEVLSYAPGGRAIVLEWQIDNFVWVGEWELWISPRLNTLELMDLGIWGPELEDSNLMGE